MSDTPEPAAPEDESRSDDGAGAADAARPEDDVKRRFREALERKNARAKAGESHADGTSKIHHTHGPAAGRRAFRRKSG